MKRFWILLLAECGNGSTRTDSRLCGSAECMGDNELPETLITIM